ILAGGNGPQGNNNEFEGLGGDDFITGNGNTRISYEHADAAVTVDLFLNTAHSTIGDDAHVGQDHLLGGITAVRGSAHNDALTVTVTSFIQPVNGVGGGGTGVADVDGSVGHDTFSGVNAIRGSSFNDTFTGSDNGNNTTESFEGLGGDDQINGGAGFDRARYD